MRQAKVRRRNKERGVAMLIALIALVLLAIIGMGFMFMTVTENSVNNNYKDSQKAYFAARGGLENVRALLAPPNATTGLGAGALWAPAMALDGNMPTKLAPTGVIYVKNSSIAAATDVDPTTSLGSVVSVNPTLDDELCHEQYGGLGMTAGAAATPCGATGTNTELMASVPAYFTPIVNPASILNSGQANALPFKWVRITNKQNFMGLLSKTINTAQPAGSQVCWDGVQEQVIPTALGNTCVTPPAPFTEMRPVWLLTALAVTPQIGQNPGSRRIVQMEVALAPPVTTNATIATSGTIKLTGKVTVNGNDDCTTNKNHLSIYSGECVPGQNACKGTAITNQVPPDQLIGNNGQTGVTAYDPTTGVVTSNGSTGQGPWPYNVDQIISQYKQMAQSAVGPPWYYNPSCSGTTCKVQNEQFGTFPTNPVTGQTESTSPIAADGTPQIVYVPGNLKLDSPKAGGDGLLIVNGDLTVDGGLEYYGLILVKGQIHFTGGSTQPVNLYGAILAGDSASAADAVGGSFSFHYSSCALKQTTSQQPPKLLATHEIMY